MHLIIKISCYLQFFLLLGFFTPPALHAGDSSAPLNHQSVLRKGFIGWRNAVQWIANNPVKSIVLGSIASGIPFVGAQQGNEFILNDAATTSLTYPTIAARSDGNIAAVWRQGNSALLRIVAENGDLLTDQVPVSASASQLWPSVTSLDDNSLCVGWHGAGNVTARFFNSSSAAVSPELQIASNLDLNSAYPAVKLAKLKNGSVLAIYMNGGASTQFLAQEFNAAGLASADPVQLDSASVARPYFVAQQALDGNIYFADHGDALRLFSFNETVSPIAQTQYADGGGLYGITGGIAGGLFNNNNIVMSWPVSGQVTAALFNGATLNVLKSAINVQGDLYASPGLEPNLGVAIFNNGTNALIAFNGYPTQSAQYANNADVYGTIIDNQGNVLVGPFVINEMTGGDQSNPVIATLPNGDVFVAWQGNQGNAQGNYQIYGKALTASYLNSLIPVPSSTASASNSTSPTGGGTTIVQVDNNYSSPSSDSFLQSDWFKIASSCTGFGLTAAGVWWRMKKAREYRQTKKLANMLREELDLGYSDFASGEGLAYCNMIDAVIKGINEHYKELGQAFEIKDCSDKELRAIAKGFASVLNDHSMVDLCKRRITTWCRRYRITLNDQILSKQNFDKIVDGVIYSIDKPILDGILTECVSSMVENPIRKSLGENRDFESIMPNGAMTPRQFPKGQDLMELVSLAQWSNKRASAATTDTPPRNSSNNSKDTPPMISDSPAGRISDTPPPPPLEEIVIAQ